MPISTMITASSGGYYNPKPKKKAAHKPASHHHAEHKKTQAAIWAIQSVDILHFGTQIHHYGLYAALAIIAAVALYFLLGGQS